MDPSARRVYGISWQPVTVHDDTGWQATSSHGDSEITWTLAYYDHPAVGAGWWLYRNRPPHLFTVSAGRDDDRTALLSASLYVTADHIDKEN